jgi:hypothetical protein
VYLYDPKAGIYLFDYYGSFKKKLPITGWQRIGVFNNYITGIKNNNLQFFNMATLLSGEHKLPTPFQTAQQVQVANNKLFYWTPNSVSIYNYPL